MAYLREIIRPRCKTCGKYATQTLRHWQNFDLANYCTPHAKTALQVQKQKEIAEDERVRS